MNTLIFLYEDCDKGKGETRSFTSEAIEKRFSSTLMSNLTKIVNSIPFIKNIQTLLIKIKSTPFNKANNKYGFSIEFLEMLCGFKLISIGFLHINNEKIFEFDLKDDINNIGKYFNDLNSKIIRLENYINIDFNNDIRAKNYLDIINEHLIYIEYVVQQYNNIMQANEKRNLFVTYFIEEEIKFQIRNSYNFLISTETTLTKNLKEITLRQFSQIDFILSNQWFTDEMLLKELKEILKIAKIMNY